MVAIIQDGGSVKIGDQIVSRVADLPNPETLASTEAEKGEALADLVRQRADLDSRINAMAAGSATSGIGGPAIGVDEVTKAATQPAQSAQTEKPAESSAAATSTSTVTGKAETGDPATQTPPGPKPLSKMNTDELKAEASTLGIVLKGDESKAAIRDAITKAKGGGNDDAYDGMTVEELTKEAGTLKVEIPADSKKEDIVALLRAKKGEGA
jgi:hypothetical protein